MTTAPAPPPLTIADFHGAASLIAGPTGPALRHLISLGDPGSAPPAGFDAHPARKLRLEFDDIERPSPTCRWYVPCSWRDVERLVAFAAGVRGPTLVHCAAGVSRSTAAAILLLCAQLGRGREADAIATVCALRPQAWPNRRILWMGDALLELGGALIAADRRWRPHLHDEPEVPARR